MQTCICMVISWYNRASYGVGGRSDGRSNNILAQINGGAFKLKKTKVRVWTYNPTCFAKLTIGPQSFDET